MKFTSMHLVLTENNLSMKKLSTARCIRHTATWIPLFSFSPKGQGLSGDTERSWQEFLSTEPGATVIVKMVIFYMLHVLDFIAYVPNSLEVLYLLLMFIPLELYSTGGCSTNCMHLMTILFRYNLENKQQQQQQFCCILINSITTNTYNMQEDNRVSCTCIFHVFIYRHKNWHFALINC